MKLEPVYLIKPKIFEPFGEVLAVMSTKKNFNSSEVFNVGFTENSEPEKVNENRKILLEQLGILRDHLAIPKQIHSSNICYVDKPRIYDNCDALVTDKREIYLVVSVADCAPVYIYDKSIKAIALVHCGWRGAKEKIVEKTVDFMVNKFKSDVDDLIAFIGPSASVCCYEVGEEFERNFDLRFLRFKRNGKYHFDLKGEIFSQLINSGLNFRNIEVSRHCTICGVDLFHSFRREGENSGRMWALFGLR
ncbi:MAG: peptidoglycan editing factor PgeF [Candidatus Kryptonium sp.]